MRSRYAAFALGLGEYLVSTLASTHEDRALDPRLLAQQLSSAKHTFKYMGLRIVHTEDTGEGGTVLFVAKMFSKGADRSFAELSTFTREGGELRYASGALVAGPDLPKEEGALTPTWILAHAR